ncbi:DUF465 domain-containing protein [Oleidesulfovibrio sp.]|uniref:DUF465 domain-containing protein n=1 Tax=Oleidesulfovibrio sp. TaxID=2909707 RepID=UPI003A83E501
METRDLELLEQLSSRNPELKALWEEHILFEKQLEKLESKPYLTPNEDKHVKELKKQKLDGKTRLLTILEGYRTKEQ